MSTPTSNEDARALATTSSAPARDEDAPDPFAPWSRRALRRCWRALAGPPTASTYWLTRFVILRGIGLVYLVAFLVAAFQLAPLIGERKTPWPHPACLH